jgi:hypothetical protein
LKTSKAVHLPKIKTRDCEFPMTRDYLRIPHMASHGPMKSMFMNKMYVITDGKVVQDES